MPLTLTAVGEEAIIRKIGGSPAIKKHLEDMGFVAGGNVTVISAIGGNLIVNVKESRVAISREMAGKIMVWPADRGMRHAGQASWNGGEHT